MQNVNLGKAITTASTGLGACLKFARIIRFPIRRVNFLILLRLVSLAFEGVGIGMIMPVFDFINHQGPAETLTNTSGVWKLLMPVMDFLSLPLSLGTLLTIVFVSVLLRQIFQYTYDVLLNLYTREQIAGAHITAFKAALATSVESIESIERGALVNTMFNEFQKACSIIWASIPVVSSLIVITAYLAMIIAISAPLTFALVAMLAAIAVVTTGLMRRSIKTGRAITSSNEKMTAFLVARLGHVRHTKLSRAEELEIASYSTVVRDLHRYSAEAKILGLRIPLIVQPLAVCLVLVLIYVGTDVLSISVGALLLFCGIALRIIPVFQNMASLVQGTFTAWGSFASVLRFVDYCEKHAEIDQGGRDFPAPQDGIRYEAVTYSYPGHGAKALASVDLFIPANRWTALVGPSGAGKSTLIDFIPKLRRPNEGRVSIDGCDVGEIALGALREKIAFVSQDPQIVSGSLLDNIAYGQPGLTEEQAVEALKTVGAWQFVEMMPEGIHTSLGEGGARLSGGQRQRIELARAVAAGAKIIILDEPTTGLDPMARIRLKDLLTAFVQRGGITLITVSHDLSFVDGANQIVLLDSGKISDVGTHSDLVKRNGWYGQARAADMASLGMEPLAQS